MGKDRDYFFNVPIGIRGEIHPLVATFMSYYTRTANISSKHLSDDLKRKETMINKLLFLFRPELENDRRWKNNNPLMFRQGELIKLIKKPDGSIMTPIEQLCVFAEFVSERDQQIVVCFLFKQNDPKPIGRTDETQSGHLNIPVVQWIRGGFAGTSVDNLFCKGKFKYCYSCAAEYECDIRHRMECRERCKWCFRIGRDFPCYKHLKFEERLKCDDCEVVFYNTDCFNSHKATKACRWRKWCSKCSQHYNTAAGRHICGQYYCKKCTTIHPKNCKWKGEFHCYINSKKLKKKHFNRIGMLFYDFETIQLKRKSATKRRLPGDEEDIADGIDPERAQAYLHVPADENDYHQVIPDFDARFDRPQTPVGFNMDFEENNGNVAFISSQDDEAFAEECDALMTPADNKKLHIVNVAGGLHKCSDCFYKKNPSYHCSYCNGGKINTFSSIPNLSRSTFIAETDDYTPLDAFRDHIIMLTENKDITEIQCFAHYASRFDSHLILRSFAKLGYAAHIQMRGNTIFQATFAKRGAIQCPIIFKDSHKFIPISLKSFHTTFNLDTNVKKGDLPHKMNLPENYGLVLETLPPKEEYGYGGLTKKLQKEFDARYDADKLDRYLKNEKWEFNEEMIKYFEQDVTVLYHGFLENAKVLNEIFEEAVASCDLKLEANQSKKYFNVVNFGSTLASISMFIQNTLYQEDNVLPYVPETGYNDATNQSKLAIAYLDWIEKKEGIRILHRDNAATGEVQFGGIRVDGYCAQNDTIYQVHGCRWHACSRCYKHGSTHMYDGRTADDIRLSEKWKMKKLQKAFDGGEIKVFWECDIHAEMKENEDLKNHMNAAPDTSPINLRKSLCGGRTGMLNTIKLLIFYLFFCFCLKLILINCKYF